MKYISLSLQPDVALRAIEMLLGNGRSMYLEHLEGRLSGVFGFDVLGIFYSQEKIDKDSRLKQLLKEGRILRYEKGRVYL
ncbi:MAG: hypothetical protein KKG75_00385 [Nanoarchaeota archaeon]|nr:hypothetical protein [Nanoarchaeota archaeon]